ncbi:hypothetical protein [Tessaracoccus coleopterorum]|uniref:hypothetical protein n=1 Tax=Tessaracoccus coleopterorum TaxID=2714950 RepID=UPI0018D37EFA
MAEELPVMASQPDSPLRYGLLLEGRDGIVLRPGLIGSRDGADWTPDWRVDRVLLDGLEVGGHVSAGAATVSFEATAADAGLGLLLEVELTPQGLVAARATVTNLAEGVFQVDELTLSLPCPGGRTRSSTSPAAGASSASRNGCP